MDFSSAFAAAVTAVLGLIVWLIQQKRVSSAAAKAKDDIVSQAMKVIIRNQIISAHRLAVSEWQITTSELQSFREMHALYISLGGNGPASHLLDDLERVKLVADTIK